MADHPDAGSAHTLPGLLGDFRLLIYLFVGLRLALAIVYQPYLFERYDAAGEAQPVERGLSVFGDFRTYYQFAQLSDDGLYPYRDYWYEFPPVWPAVFIGLYRAMQARGAVDFTAWATALGLVLLLVDMGNLALLRRLGRRLYGERVGTALAWVYAALAAPLILTWWAFEGLVVFTVLLALDHLFAGREGRSALAAAVGMLAKYTPVLILPAVWRFSPRRRAQKHTAIVVAVTAIVLGVLLARGGRMAEASLVAQFNKASYQSVWALLDGNWTTGNFGDVASRFNPDAAFEPLGKDALLPWWLRLIPFAAFGLYLYRQPLRDDRRGVFAFFTVTVMLFFLWAQGWSPQWVMTLIPLALLNYPNREGVLWCLVLSTLSFVEYPILFMRTGETGGAIGPALRPLYVTIVLVRTGLLVGMVAALVGRLREGASHAAA